MKKKLLPTVGLSVLIAGALTLLAGTGVLRRADLAVSDGFYRNTRAVDEQSVVIVGIDQRAIEELGPYPWSRDVMAQVLEALNQSEDCRPAAIGLDILYSGETGADQRLAEAAGAYGNVVTASLAEYGDALAEDGRGDFRLVPNTFLGLDEPYEALRAVTEQGHINAVLDEDGILRFHRLSLALPGGQELPSMALQLVRMYRSYWGEDPAELPPTESGYWRLPFFGGPGSFDEGISVVDVLSGAVPADYFAGMIVLIGPYTEGLQDSYLTSVDHTQPMYGVEIHANAVYALLEGSSYTQNVGDGLQLALLFVLLLACLACFWQRPVWLATALWLALSGGWLLACRALFARGWILHVLWVPVGATILYGGSLAFNYIGAALERRRVTNTFKKYVAPEVVSEILQGGIDIKALGGKLTDIAVLFVDIRGFTPMSEGLPPERVMEIVNRYLTLISQCIMKHHGTLDKFIGDAAMAFWGAPLPQEDYVMHAVQAAADMVSGSRALSRELLEQYGRTVSFGIGVHVGQAVVGNVGSPQRMDYTAIGDTVNTAARLEANAPGGTIYISRAVADALEGRIRTTSLGDSIKLKGKKEGFEVLIMEEIL